MRCPFPLRPGLTQSLRKVQILRGARRPLGRTSFGLSLSCPHPLQQFALIEVIHLEFVQPLQGMVVDRKTHLDESFVLAGTRRGRRQSSHDLSHRRLVAAILRAV